jgi:hypothetical protein
MKPPKFELMNGGEQQRTTISNLTQA